MASSKPTIRQLQFLLVVHRLTLELKRSPSAEEVAKKLGISRQGASKQLIELEEKGFLKDSARRVRSGRWKLTEQCLAWLNQGGG